MIPKFVSIILILALGITSIHYVYKLPEFEREKCPFCFGEDYCDDIASKKFTLRYNDAFDIINHVLSVKNVFFLNEHIVLKKLGHSKELREHDRYICRAIGHPSNCDLSTVSNDIPKIDYVANIRKVLKHNHRGYRLCGSFVVGKFLKNALETSSESHLWTSTIINLEPFILKIFNSDLFPLPAYYGACGRFILVENAGVDLNKFANASWLTRARIACNLIDAAFALTEGNSDFRLYLTDISPDNIAVNEKTLEVKFIDVGNFILTEKVCHCDAESDTHCSVDHSSENDEFSYSEDAICESCISDHNVYSICKLLLSEKAPWPMMTGGLLHSIPPEMWMWDGIVKTLIDSCIHPNYTSEDFRFSHVKILERTLHNIIDVHDHPDGPKWENMQGKWKGKKSAN